MAGGSALLPCLESQPCPYDVKCLAPIKENSFLKFFQTREAVSYPPGLIGLETCFDSLGCATFIIENKAQLPLKKTDDA